MIQIKDELLDIEGIKNSKKPLLDLFIRRTAVLTSTAEHITEKIIKDQWREANRQSQPINNTSEIDFCNLGTFFISKNKGYKRMLRNQKKIDEINLLPLGEDEKVNQRNEQMKENYSVSIRQIQFKLKQTNNEIQ